MPRSQLRLGIFNTALCVPKIQGGKLHRKLWRATRMHMELFMFEEGMARLLLRV